jgi:CRP/FNR family transcriptional regulator, cyclic AMP receptor protein
MSGATTTLQLLKSIRVLADLPDQVLVKLAPLTTVEHATALCVLFKEGSFFDRVFFVLEGLVALDMHVPRRNPTRVLTVGSGELLAWSAILSDQRMTATATALEDTRLLSIAAQPLRQLCDADHDMGYALMHCMASALSRRLLATRLQLLDLFSETQPV